MNKIKTQKKRKDSLEIITKKTTTIKKHSKKHYIFLKIMLALFLISVIIGVIVHIASPFFKDYIIELFGIFLSVICLAANFFSPKFKQIYKRKRLNPTFKKYITDPIIIFSCSLILIVFSVQIAKTLYNTVEYVTGNIAKGEFKISYVEISSQKSDRWIESAQATNINTNVNIEFDCDDLRIHSLEIGKTYYIEYIPGTNRLFYVRYID